MKGKHRNELPNAARDRGRGGPSRAGTRGGPPTVNIVLTASTGAPAPAPAAEVRVVPGAEPVPPPDPMALLRGSQNGTALFAALPTDEGGRQVSLLVRGGGTGGTEPLEPSALTFRAGLFTQAESGLALVPVVLQVGPTESEDYYEAWVNESPGGGRETLEALAKQERLTVCLYGAGCQLERVVALPNPLRAFAHEALGETAEMRLATGDALHQARHAVYRQHPSVRSLWRALAG